MNTDWSDKDDWYKYISSTGYDAMRKLADGIRDLYPYQGERIYSGQAYSATYNLAPSNPSYNGNAVLNARQIVRDGPDKFIKRALSLPFVPQVGTTLCISDIDANGEQHDFVLHVKGLEWYETDNRFQVRCDVIDGQMYDTLADAVYWENYK